MDLIQKRINDLNAELEKMYAVELLEYHDKNHLSGDNKSRSETRQQQLKYSMELVKQMTQICKGQILPIHNVTHCDAGEYCDDCGDYVDNGCDNKDCKHNKSCG